MTENITQNLDEIEDLYLFTPKAKDTFVYITRDEYTEIIRQIEQDDSLLEALASFEKNWHAVNESDDLLAEVDPVKHAVQFYNIIEAVTKTSKTNILFNTIIFRYLKIK